MPRLLLVDDNPSIHKIVASLLDSTAIGVLHANDAEEALKFIEGGADFDLALLDTTLPNLDGWGLLERLRSDARTETKPIAMMAGVLEDVDLARIEKAPIQAFLRKPVDLRDLADKVAALVAMPNMPTIAPSRPAEPEVPLVAPLPPAEPAAPPDAPLQSAELDAIPEAPSPPEEPAAPVDVPSPPTELDALSDTSLQPLEPDAPPDAPLQSAELDAFPEAPSPPKEPADVSLQPAEPEAMPEVQPQLADAVPSDLLVLEAQDLAQEIVLAEPIGADANEEESPPEEHATDEAISIELEDLDLSKIDQLVAPDDEQPSLAQVGPGSDPDNFLDTAPGDFGPELEPEDDQIEQHSPIANELLADREFIKAVAKEVAKNMSLHGDDA